MPIAYAVQGKTPTATVYRTRINRDKMPYPEADARREPLTNADLMAKAVAYLEENGFDSMDSIGFCKDCGSDYYGIEPDAYPGNSQYTCDDCGSSQVYGVEAVW